MIKLAIVCTHPIQYYVPVFKLLAQKTEIKVFYTRGKDAVYDNGFQQFIHWDIPLLDGYDHEFLINTAQQPNSIHFNGIKNPEAIASILKFNPDRLLVYGWAHHSHLQIIRHFNRKLPILFRGDSTLLNSTPFVKRLAKKYLLNWIYKQIDIALYTGSHNKKYYNAYGLKERQLIFCPHAVDNARFHQQGNLPVREILNVQETDLLIVFAGKLEPIKNPNLLAQAFLELNLPHTHLLFTGSGILEKELKTRCCSNNNIHFLPFQNQQNMPSIYQAADLFCLPSIKESWGLAINEAMAAGKAVLVSDQAGAAIDLVRQTNGTTFKSGSKSDLKQKLTELMTTRNALRLQGASSLTIIQSWNFETQVKSILNAL
ncbi:glycosyltransferase family 4 protein [Pedobacter metabolipauper]|uniref:Glycosyltransferase involved in cell wall biosynthesis n=1 Tax=Pedobacter metabolipauper TaxID=425513 RepID=A0A4R6SW78_9SPHI|nr:glycosyltransferase family 4 protein [Pedobacter metabolipauper]TDQ08631.1 glycosyltransferase involved in cell wall biosynthesis [Pedobacter metabolipauper]